MCIDPIGFLSTCQHEIDFLADPKQDPNASIVDLMNSLQQHKVYCEVTLTLTINLGYEFVREIIDSLVS